MKISLYFGYIVPYCFLVLLNSAIIYKATQFERHQQPTTETRSAKRKTQMTRMIIFITFLYIVTSLPSTIITGYLYDNVSSLDVGQMIINLIDGIQFSYPAFNLFILFFSNKLFAEELKRTFPRFLGERNRVSTTRTKSNTNAS